MQTDVLKRRARLCLLILLLSFIEIISLSGCQSQKNLQQRGTVRLVGAKDVIYLAEAVKEDFNKTTNQNIEFVDSTDVLADLDAGKADAALLGREPTAVELTKYDDYVIAYDAVCILIDARTYQGGIQDTYVFSGVNVSSGSGQPGEKYEGLQNLSLDNLRGFYSQVLDFSNSLWKFQGPGSSYFTFQPYVDADNNNPSPDTDHPGWYLGMWVFNSVNLYGYALPPGSFDTQAALLQKLEIPESVLNNSNISFVGNIYDSEELLISRKFNVNMQQIKTESTDPFDFELVLASRRVTEAALQHHFGLRALSIDGIDPLSDPSVIYNGTYPLSRKIHLLIRKPDYYPAVLFENYLLSPSGQAQIAKANFLPLP